MDKFWTIEHPDLGIYCGLAQAKPQWDRFTLRRAFKVEKYLTIEEADKARARLLRIYPGRSIKVVGPFLHFNPNS